MEHNSEGQFAVFESFLTAEHMVEWAFPYDTTQQNRNRDSEVALQGGAHGIGRLRRRRGDACATPQKMSSGLRTGRTR